MSEKMCSQASQVEEAEMTIEEAEARVEQLKSEYAAICSALDVVIALQKSGTVSRETCVELSRVLKFGMPIVHEEGRPFACVETPAMHVGNPLAHILIGMVVVERDKLDIEKLVRMNRDEKLEREARNRSSRKTVFARGLWTAAYLTLFAARQDWEVDITEIETELVKARMSPEELAEIEKQAQAEAEAAEAKAKAAEKEEEERKRFLNDLLADMPTPEAVAVPVRPMHAHKETAPGTSQARAKELAMEMKRLRIAILENVGTALRYEGRAFEALNQTEQDRVTDNAVIDGQVWALNKFPLLTDDQREQVAVAVITEGEVRKGHTALEIDDTEMLRISKKLLAQAKDILKPRTATKSEPTQKSERTAAELTKELITSNREGRHPKVFGKKMGPEEAVRRALGKVCYDFRLDTPTPEVVAAAKEAIADLGVAAHKVVELFLVERKARMPAQNPSAQKTRGQLTPDADPKRPDLVTDAVADQVAAKERVEVKTSLGTKLASVMIKPPVKEVVVDTPAKKTEKPAAEKKPRKSHAKKIAVAVVATGDTPPVTMN